MQSTISSSGISKTGSYNFVCTLRAFIGAALLEWYLILLRLTRVRLTGHFAHYLMCAVDAPTLDTDDSIKDAFYDGF